MSVSEKWGTDVDTAVQLALEELDATIDEVNVTVLEQPSRGFFGIGSKLALVRVELKEDEEEQVSVSEETVKEEASSEKTQDLVETHVEEQGETAEELTAVSDTDTENEVAEDEVSSLEILEEHGAKAFLDEVVEKMGLDVKVTAKTDGKDIYLSVDGRDSGTIIGKRGQTLDAIQYLTSLVVNKDSKDYVRVVVDAENYRSKREKTLEKLANRLADKVVKSKRSVKLEPMNPYERKVIHSTLQGHSRVTTRSEGQDPYRRVIIELK